jgi:hypothetical protein
VIRIAPPTAWPLWTTNPSLTNPGSVPPDVVDTINAQPSLPLLESWFDAATTSPSIEEFIAVLRR